MSSDHDGWYVCARCGRRFGPLMEAMIGDESYCHRPDSTGPTCYSTALAEARDDRGDQHWSFA